MRIVGKLSEAKYQPITNQDWKILEQNNTLLGNINNPNGDNIKNKSHLPDIEKGSVTPILLRF